MTQSKRQNLKHSGRMPACTWACVVAPMILAALASGAAAQPIDGRRNGRAKDASANRQLRAEQPRRSSDCEPDCPDFDVYGNQYEPQAGGSVASPAGTTYSVHHRLGSVPAGGGVEQTTCFRIPPPGGPVPDSIVRFDDIVEDITPYPDLFGGALPEVAESVAVTPSGTFLINIRTDSLHGADLFPGGFVDQQGQDLTHACFTLGLDDLLDWPGMDNVVAATLEFTIDNGTAIGPLDVTSSFSDPWDGFVNVVVENAAGMGINGARLEFLAAKDVIPPNDDCVNAVGVADGSFSFSNVGATTDGPDEPDVCDESKDSHVQADVWYEYTATCTGNLSVDLCGSFYDTKVALYEGCNACPPEQAPVACNDDFPLCGSLGEQSRLSAAVTEGSCYTLRIGGFQGDQGPGTLRITCTGGACCQAGECSDGVLETACLNAQGKWFPNEECASFTCPPAPPSNDECAGAIAVERGTPFVGSNESAATSTQVFCTSGDVSDVWHKWTADCTGLATFSLCGSQITDTTLAVFDGCEGYEVACDEDGCTGSAHSELSMMVEEGTTYFLRVAGRFPMDVGEYTLNVTGCKVGCCLDIGACTFVADETTCIEPPFSGTPIDRTVPCRLRDIDRSGVDDACEACPMATIAFAAPPHGTVDARQPHAADNLRPGFGIGAPGGDTFQREPIVMTLDPPVSGATHCFRLCETMERPGFGANDIDSATELRGGQYELILRRAITPGALTTIRYVEDGSFVEYIGHPANVDGDASANVDDITEFVECCLHGSCAPEWTPHSCDLDHSGRVTPVDVLTGIDLLVGAQDFASWRDTPRPVNTICPSAVGWPE